MNAQIEAHLNALAEICCATLQGDAQQLSERRGDLLKSLLMSGYSRQHERPLSLEIEKRVKDLCLDIAKHRATRLTTMATSLQKDYEELARWESNTFENDTTVTAPSRPASVSASTNE